MASVNVLPFEAPWIGDNSAYVKLDTIYKLQHKSPLFHPQGVLDKTHYQLECNARVVNLIENHATLDSEAEEKVLKKAMSNWVSWNVLAVRNKSDGTAAPDTGGTPEIFGVTMRISPVLMSLLSHVDCLAEDQINTMQRNAIYFLRHNGQPGVNERDLTSGHDFLYKRETVVGASPDIITSCMGKASSSIFRSSFAVTPMRRMQRADDTGPPENARFVMFDGLSDVDPGLARGEYADCMDVASLEALFKIVSKKETLRTILNKDHLCAAYYRQKEGDKVVDDEVHATFFLRATHCILAMIDEKYNGLKAWKDIVSFVLRLYNLDENLKKVQDANLTTAKELKVFGRISELIYFGRVMFNNQFDFRLPVIDGATRKFGMDYALMRLKPAKIASEASQQETFVFEIQPDVMQDAHDYISPMLQEKLVLELYWAGLQSTELQERVEMLRTLSTQLNTVAHTIRGNTFASRMHTILNKEGQELKFLDPAEGSSWKTDRVKQVGEDNDDKWFISTCFKKQTSLFTNHVISELKKESALDLLERPKEDGHKSDDGDGKTLEEKIRASVTSIWKRQGCWPSEVLNYHAFTGLLQFFIHGVFGEENFHTSMLDVRLEYLQRDGKEFTFKKFQSENGAFNRTEYRGNFPLNKKEDWLSYNHWARDVVLKCAFVFKGFFQCRFICVETSEILRTREILLAIGQTEVYSMVNTFGHEIALKKSWISEYPLFMSIMKPAVWTASSHSTNIPHGLFLLWCVAAWEDFTKFSFKDTWAKSSVLDEGKDRTWVNYTRLANLIPHFQLGTRGGNDSYSSSSLFCELLENEELLAEIEIVLASKDFPTDTILKLCTSGLLDKTKDLPRLTGQDLANKCFFPDKLVSTVMSTIPTARSNKKRKGHTKKPVVSSKKRNKSASGEGLHGSVTKSAARKSLDADSMDVEEDVTARLNTPPAGMDDKVNSKSRVKKPSTSDDSSSSESSSSSEEEKEVCTPPASCASEEDKEESSPQAASKGKKKAFVSAKKREATHPSSNSDNMPEDEDNSPQAASKGKTQKVQSTKKGETPPSQTIHAAASNVPTEELINDNPGARKISQASVPIKLNVIAPSFDFVDPDIGKCKHIFNGYECPYFLKLGIPGRPRDFLGDGSCTVYSLFYYLWVKKNKVIPADFFSDEMIPKTMVQKDNKHKDVEHVVKVKHPIRHKVVAWMRKQLQMVWKENEKENENVNSDWKKLCCSKDYKQSGTSMTEEEDRALFKACGCSITEEDFDKEAGAMFQEKVDYSARKVDDNLMDANCVLRLFARGFDVSVVVYSSYFENLTWTTTIYREDGSASSQEEVQAQDFRKHPLQLVNYYPFMYPTSDSSKSSETSHTVILEEESVTRLSAGTEGDEIAQAMADPGKTLVVTDCLREKLVWNDILTELQGVQSSGSIVLFDKHSKKHLCYLPLAEKKECRTKGLALNKKPNYTNYLECNQHYPKKIAYWRDIAMEDVTPIFYAKFLKSFMLPKYLPAGEGCLHKHLGGPRDRPLLGPLAYFGPSEAVTSIHEDGGGTVDSGHLNVYGYNQILIFPRMTGDQRKMARRIMDLDESMRWMNPGNLWPTLDMLRRLLAQRIIPVSVVLSPGEFLHINKGRLHCFMKAFAPPVPPKSDVEPCNPPQTPALSIAWDWVNIGEVVGECDEVSYSLERSKENQTNGVASLAWPETCLIKMLLKMKLEDVPPKQLAHMKCILTRQIDWGSIVSEGELTVMVVADEDDGYQAAEKSDSSAERQNTVLGRAFMPVPIPIADSFRCGVCNFELSNVYFQCGGCRILLNQNFLVCGFCYKAGKHKEWMHLEHSFSSRRESSVNHTVNDRPSTSTCGTCDLLCHECKKCVKCKCVCHTQFVCRFRFLHSVALKGKLKSVNNALETQR